MSVCVKEPKYPCLKLRMMKCAHHVHLNFFLASLLMHRKETPLSHLTGIKNYFEQQIFARLEQHNLGGVKIPQIPVKAKATYDSPFPDHLQPKGGLKADTYQHQTFLTPDILARFDAQPSEPTDSNDDVNLQYLMKDIRHDECVLFGDKSWPQITLAGGTILFEITEPAGTFSSVVSHTAKVV
jgi:hypothetical protein